MHLTNHINAIAGILTVLCTAIVFGTDSFFAFVGKKALSKSKEAALLNVAGNLHEVADKRMPIVGGAALLGTLYLALSKGVGTHDGILFLIAFIAMLAHLLLFLSVAKPVNEQMREAVRFGRLLDDVRALQNKWDSVIGFRAILLLTAMVFLLTGLGLRV